MQALFDAVNAICEKSRSSPTCSGISHKSDWYAAIPILGNFSLAIILLVGTGIFLTFKLRFIQVRKFRYGLNVLLHSRSGKTGISSLAAFLLSTAMRVGPATFWASPAPSASAAPARCSGCGSPPSSAWPPPLWRAPWLSCSRRRRVTRWAACPSMAAAC